MGIRPRFRDSLNVYVTYDNVPASVHVDPAFVTFRVVSNDDSPAVRLDEQTGFLTAVHPGQTLIESSFGGRTNFTCVAVVEAIDGVHTYPKLNCQQLLPDGARLGTQE